MDGKLITVGLALSFVIAVATSCYNNKEGTCKSIHIIERLPYLCHNLCLFKFVHQLAFLDCLKSFKLSHHGYFKYGWINKGTMSNIVECACACIQDTHCVAFDFRSSDFRHDAKRCFFYKDVSNLDQKLTEDYSEAYIKRKGNN